LPAPRKLCLSGGSCLRPPFFFAILPFFPSFCPFYLIALLFPVILLFSRHFAFFLPFRAELGAANSSTASPNVGWKRREIPPLRALAARALRSE
jgi:hypothetical protein